MTGGFLVNAYIGGGGAPAPPQGTIFPFPYSAVSFHSHFDGADAATTAIDESDLDATLTFAGNAQLDTSAWVYGGSSLLLDGTGDYVTAPNNAAYRFQDGDFTIEAWVRWNASPGGTQQVIAGLYDGTANQRSWRIEYDLTGLRWVYSTTGINFPTLATVSFTPDVGAWYHIAVARADGVFRYFVDGSQLGSDIVHTSNYHESTAALSIGARAVSGTPTSFLNANVDEVRVIRGVGLYTADFDLAPKEYDFHRAVLIADFDGIDGQTAGIKSQDRYQQEATFEGDAQLDDAQTKNGVTSLLCDGVGDRVTFPHIVEQRLAANDFTLEAWIRFAAIGASNLYFLSKWAAGGNFSYSFGLNVPGQPSPGINFVYSSTGANVLVLNRAWSPSAGIWYHVAVTRSGSDGRLFIDGAMQGAVHNFGPGAFFDSSAVLEISGQDNAAHFNGNIDSPRIIVGKALYTEDFDRPALEFERTSGTLLTGFNGADAATTLTTEDAGARTVTFNGNAQLDTAQRRLGTASLLLDGTGDYVTIPDSADLELAGNDFTMDCFARFNGDPGSNAGTFLAKWNNDSGTSAWVWGKRATGTDVIEFVYSVNGTNGIVLSYTWDPAGDIWYFLSLVRDGSDVRFYVDGKLIGTQSIGSDVIANVATAISVGAFTVSGVASEDLDGHIDEVRITVGEALYKEDFTPPTRAADRTTSEEYFASQVLAGFDGVDAATAYTTEDRHARTVSFVADAQLDTAQSAFGSASLLLDGTGDYASIPDDAALNLGANDFTIECRVRFNGDPGTSEQNFLAKWNANGVSQRSWALQFFDNTMRFVFSTNGSTASIVTAPWNPAGDTWYHVVFTREGTTGRFFIDGPQIGTDQTVSGTLFASNSAMWFGVVNGISGFQGFFNGHMDEVRILTDRAVYTAAFTSPDGPYPRN